MMLNVVTLMPAFDTAIARIYPPQGTKAVGCGFLIAPGLVMTAAHVVTHALGGEANQMPDRPVERVRLDFPFASSPGVHAPQWASVVLWLPPGDAHGDDIAVLKLETDAPTAARPVVLAATEILSDLEIEAFGFPDGYQTEGVWAEGITRRVLVHGRVQIDGTTSLGYFLEQGFSGTPVFSKASGRVLGMVVSADLDPTVRSGRMIPVNRLLTVLNTLPEELKMRLPLPQDGGLEHLSDTLISREAIAAGKVFLSYSCKNREFAKALYAKLERMGFDLWRDVHDIDAGADDWWQSVEDAIRECDTVILCMSLPALKSSVVGDEWFYARTLGKRIIPVVADDIWTHPDVVSGAFTIPNWMQRRNWIDFRAQVPEAEVAWATLIRTLNESYAPKKFINMVGELPPRFVRRSEETDRAVRALVDDNHDAIAMTTALRGAGGYGKTTLAKAIARDIRIQGAFDDGILWVTLGEELLQKRGHSLDQSLIARVRELIDAL